MIKSVVTRALSLFGFLLAVVLFLSVSWLQKSDDKDWLSPAVVPSGTPLSFHENADLPPPSPQQHQQQQQQHTVRQLIPDPQKTREMLDFAIVGFSKCGTTFLTQNLLGDSPQCYMGAQNSKGGYEEMHHLEHEGQLNEFLSYFRDRINRTTSDGAIIRNGYKAPNALLYRLSLENLSTYFPNTKFIVTTRHPILWFESLWNFKMRLRKFALDRKITPSNRIGECKDGCKRRKTCIQHQFSFGCTDLSNYHIHLARLGWTPMNTTEEMDLLDQRVDRRFSFPHSQMFLMEIGQMDATRNQTRAHEFIHDLEHFLDLSQGALKHLTSRETHSTNTTDQPSTSDRDDPNANIPSRRIQICDPQYQDVRMVLLEQGQKASRWISEYFLQSDHVVVSNREHFLQLIESWKIDPCDLGVKPEESNSDAAQESHGTSSIDTKYDDEDIHDDNDLEDDDLEDDGHDLKDNENGNDLKDNENENDLELIQ